MSIDTDVGCPASCAILGAGRAGTALAAALRAAGIAVEGPLGRGEVPTTRISGRPCRRVIPVGSARRSFVEKLPSVQMILGRISST